MAAAREPEMFRVFDVPFKVSKQKDYPICAPTATADCISHIFYLKFGNRVLDYLPLSPQPFINHIKYPDSCFCIDHCLQYAKDFGLSPLHKYPFSRIKHNRAKKIPDGFRLKISNYILVESHRIPSLLWTFRLPIIGSIHLNESVFSDDPNHIYFSGIGKCQYRDGELNCKYSSLHHAVIIKGYDHKRACYYIQEPNCGEITWLIHYTEVYRALTPVLHDNFFDCMHFGGSLESQDCESDGLVRAEHESAEVIPVIPAPTVPKQQLPRKELGAVDEPKAAEATPVSTAMRDSQFSAGTPNTKAPQCSDSDSHQVGGQNSQVQSLGIANTPMPIPIQLPLGNPSQQQVFVPGIQSHPMQPHPMQPQGIIHQGHSMKFSSQMGSPQLPRRLDNIGISLGPLYQQQQMGKFGSAHKAVNITHPDTHQELRLNGGSSFSRAHPNLPPPSQPIPSFPPGHAINYYYNNLNANLFYQAPSSLPLAKQINPSSQPQRLFNQVTVKPAAGFLGEKPVDSLLAKSSAGVDKAGFPKFSRRHAAPGSALSQTDSEIISRGSRQSNSTSVPVPTITPASEVAAASSREQNVNYLSSALTPVSSEGSEIARMEAVRSVAIKDESKKPGKKDLVIPQDQHGQSVSLSSSPS